MTKETQVRFYLGANSPGGFYSLYDQLMDPLEASNVLILKGGPGCGKSELMQKVAKRAEDRGLQVEYILAPGNSDSLDAIILPEKNAAVVDGTAPHVVEPRVPGVVERYVSLDSCYDRTGLGDIRKEILQVMSGHKEYCTRAYRCLSAAAEISEDMRAIVTTQEVEDKMAKRAKGILSREVRKSGSCNGKVTQRFLSAVTYRGLVCEMGTVDRLCRRVYELQDSYGLAHHMLVHLLAGALSAGHDVIACPSPMAPDRLEHLILPDLSLAFVSGAVSLPSGKRPYRRIRLDAMANPEAVQRNKARLKFSRKVSNALVEEAVTSLAQAKIMEDELELLYRPYVDFEVVRQLTDKLTRELWDN